VRAAELALCNRPEAAENARLAFAGGVLSIENRMRGVGHLTLAV